jgi:DNA invertase Pin-like site-specific DNA recombinase
MKRVAFYTRLSPNPDKDDTTNQERDLIEYAKRQGWEVVEHYKDIHVSGSKEAKDRPQLRRMFEDARVRKFDVLLFWSLDRLSREGSLQTLQYLNTLNSYGVDYVSYTEQYIDSCGMLKDAVIAIMAAIAKQERIRLIDRTKAGLQTARAKGVKLGRPRTGVDLEKARGMRMRGFSIGAIARILKVSESVLARRLSVEATTNRRDEKVAG